MLHVKSKKNFLKFRKFFSSTIVLIVALFFTASTVFSANLPGTPTGLTATPGSHQISLSWTAPASDGGSAITDYVIEYERTSDNDTGWTVFNDGVSTATSTIVTGLTNNVSYDFRVSAKNAVGQGANTQSVLALGGTITSSGGYRIHTFTASGDSFVVPNGKTKNVEILVVAGGGGGSGDNGGGGGGGGIVYS